MLRRCDHDRPRPKLRAGFEQGFADVLARLDFDTFVLLLSQTEVAACLADLEDPVTQAPHAVRISKTPEVARLRGWVTDWEFSDYVQRL